MALARHNGGRFASHHQDGLPVIDNYSDAYSFLVRSPQDFTLEDAVSVHIFNLRLWENLDRKEAIEKKILSDTEIDKYIGNTYSANFLLECHEKAKDAILNYRLKRSFLSMSAFGAWQGLLGNLLTAIVVALLILGGYIVKESSLGASLSAYYERCIAPPFRHGS
jgi:hypothetical protein